MHGKYHTLTVFIEYSKVFDTLEHAEILTTLEKIEITGTYLEWLILYLSIGKFMVKVSDRKNCKAGSSAR